MRSHFLSMSDCGASEPAIWIDRGRGRRSQARRLIAEPCGPSLLAHPRSGRQWPGCARNGPTRTSRSDRGARPKRTTGMCQKAALEVRGPITGRAFRVLRDWSYFQRGNSDPKLLALIRAGRARGSASFAGTLGLHRRAWHRTVGAEHTAITLLRPQLRAAARAHVKELTSVRRHSLAYGCPAMRTSNRDSKIIAQRRRVAQQTAATTAPTIPVLIKARSRMPSSALGR